MVTHLRQDTAAEGNIQTFAEIIGLVGIRPFTIKYKGMVVPGGAAIGEFSYFNPRNSEADNDDCFRNYSTINEFLKDIEISLYKFGLKPKIKIFCPDESKKFYLVGVSSGAAIKSEFLEQIAGSIQVYVAAEMEQSAIMTAQELGITLIDVGHYETELPGMQRLAKKLKADERTKHIPIVILTAYPNADELAKEAGADDYLSKPFELADLWNMAAKHTQF